MRMNDISVKRVIRDELAARGDELRKRLAATLRTVHGFESEKLIEFGLRPQRGRGRDTKTRKRRNQPEPAPAPAAAPGSTSQ